MGIYDTTKEYGLEALDKARRFKKWQAQKLRDYTQWQEDMGYNEGRHPFVDISDFLGFTGTDAPAFDPKLRGTGEVDSLIFKKIPDAWKSYDTQKQFADAGVEMTPEKNPILDKSQKAMNLISDASAWPFNALQSGLEFLPDIPHLTKTAAQEAWRYGDEKLNPFNINKDRNISSPTGTGAWWTQMQDMIGTNPIAKALSFGSVVPTNMQKDSKKFVESAYPPLDADGYFDTDLSNWPEYQTFKSGRGWDNADDRRINKRVESTIKNKPIPPDEILQDFYKLAQENMDTVIGPDGITGADLVASPDAVNHYFQQYFNGVKEMSRNNLRNEYEFQEIGQDFADWMSTNYRNESIGDYGMYPVFDEYGDDQIEILTQDISPFASAPANLSLANKEYIDALKSGKEDIGEPLEWDYGAYDKSPGYGIPKEHKKWFEYNTKEAEKVFESNQAEGLELAALIVVNAPAGIRGPIHRWLQRTGMGKILRESMPGLFQHGSRVNFGLPKFTTHAMRGYPGKGSWKTGQWWKTGLNIPAQTIDFLRPKGGQFLGAIALGEMGSNWDRN